MKLLSYLILTSNTHMWCDGVLYNETKPNLVTSLRPFFISSSTVHRLSFPYNFIELISHALFTKPVISKRTTNLNGMISKTTFLYNKIQYRWVWQSLYWKIICIGSLSKLLVYFSLDNFECFFLSTADL